jgi:PAS domain S-box-containing protein
MPYHRLLVRQLNAHSLSSTASHDAFLQAVSDAYDQSDADRALLERSLDLSSDELLQANTDLRAVVQAFPDLFLWLDRSGRITMYRARTAEDLFLPEMDLVGRSIQEVPSPEVRAKFRQAVDAINEGAPIVTVEYALTVQGKVRHYEARLLPLLDTNILAIIRNMTDRRQAELALRERDQQLQQAQRVEALGVLAGGIAHDFNNLLTAVLGFCSMLQESLRGRNEDLQRLEQIQIAATRASVLTRQLLAYGRKQVLEGRLVDLNVVVSGITRLVGPLLGTNIQIKTALSQRLGAVFADPGQVEQVIMNLVLNARDAMPNGGTITIATSDVLEATEPLSGLVGEGNRYRVQVAVSDTGCGMDASTRVRIFEPFFTTKDRTKGSGLGLSMVYGIVKQSGGEIEVWSEVGAGTTFRILFPRAENDLAEVTTGVEAGLPVPTRTVLLVDDEELVRGLAREFLVREGYRVLEASCATEALAVEEGFAESIDALVTDFIMPGASGAELAASLAKRRPETRVLYMSGYPGEVMANRGALKEGSRILQKPFTAETLAGMLRELLSSSGVPSRI